MASEGTIQIVDPSSMKDFGVEWSMAPPGTPTNRIKAPAVADESLKEQAMSAAQLSEWVFDSAPVPTTTVAVETPVDAPIPVSSSSSTCTRDSDAGTFSDAERATVGRDVSERLNAKISMRKTSRQGRVTQRWSTCPDSGDTVRLTTGCVPILKDGRILFVSASRKPEWIIPKGGWETDETMEESAIREAFEEAGVLGVFGPQLSPVQYETRKAKKRRTELEEVERQRKIKAETEKWKVDSESDDGFEKPKPVEDVNAAAPTVSLTAEAIARIRGQKRALQCDETSSVASTLSGAYSQVKMSLFPLYVSKVLEKWPESGRFRKAVPIDEAVAMLESRPELQKAVMEVRDRGLHLGPNAEPKA